MNKKAFTLVELIGVIVLISIIALIISPIVNSTIKKGKQLLQLIQVNPGYIYKESGRIYGYARISRAKQSIDRQIRNIKSSYPAATIIQEVFTRTSLNRKEWQKLYYKV